jgi:tetratricopeptide (TPR) repeat protein
MKETTPDKNLYLLLIFKALVKYEACGTLCIGAEVRENELAKAIERIAATLEKLGLAKFKTANNAYRRLIGDNPTDDVVNRFCIALLKEKYGYSDWHDFVAKETPKTSISSTHRELYPLVRKRCVAIIYETTKAASDAQLAQEQQALEEVTQPLKARLYDLGEQLKTVQAETNQLRHQIAQANQQEENLKSMLAEKEASFEKDFEEEQALRRQIEALEATHRRATAAAHDQIKQLKTLLNNAEAQIEALKKQAVQDQVEEVLAPVYALLQDEQWEQAMAWLTQDEANEAHQTTQLVGDKWQLRGQIYWTLLQTDQATRCYQKATEYRPFAGRWEALSDFYEQTHQPLAQAQSLQNALYHTPSEPDQARLAFRLGFLYDTLQRYGQSEQYYLQALGIYERLAGQNSEVYEVNLISTYHNLGSLYKMLRSYDESEKYYLQVLGIMEGLTTQKSEIYEAVLSIIYHDLGSLHETLLSFDKSERYYHQALGIRERLAAQNPEVYEGELGSTYHNLGSLHVKLRSFAESERYYLQALGIRERLAAQNPEVYEGELGSTYHNLGSLHEKLPSFAESESYYLQALGIYERLAKKTPEFYESDWSSILNNLGHLYYNKRCYDESEKYYCEALVILERLAKQKPKYKDILGAIYCNLGSLYYQLQCYDESEKYSLKACDIREQLVEKYPKVYEKDLGYSYHNLGSLHVKLRSFAESKKYYLQALGIMEQLTEQNPEIYRSDLSSVYNNLGSLYYQLQCYDESEKYYFKALNIRKLLAKQKFGVFESDLSHTYANFGDLYYKCQRYEQSENYYLQGLGIMERLAAKNPEVYEVDLAIMLYGFATLAQKQKKPYNEIVLRAIRLLEQHRVHPQSQQLLFDLYKMATYFKEGVGKISTQYQKVVQQAEKEQWEGVINAVEGFESFYQKLPLYQQTEDQDLYAEALMWRGRAYSVRTEMSVGPAKESLQAAHRLLVELEEVDMAWQNGWYLMQEWGKELPKGWWARFSSNATAQAAIMELYQALHALGHPQTPTFSQEIEAFVKTLKTP